MANPGGGHKSYFQIGLETVYGTKIAATQRAEFISCNIAPAPGQARDPSLNNQRSRRGHFRTGIIYRGTLRIRMNYVGKAILMLLDGLFGTATYGVKGSSAADIITPFAHPFVELPEVNSYTIEVIEGNVPATKCQVYVGAMVVGVTLNVAAGLGDDVMMTADFDIVARDKQDTQTPTAAPSAPVPNPVLGPQATMVDDGVNTTGIVVRSATIRYTAPVTEDRFGLGSYLLNQPLASDFVGPTMSFTEEFNNVGLLQAMTAETIGSPELVFTNTHTFTIRMSEAKLTEQPTPIEGYGTIMASATWEGFRTSTNPDSSALYIKLENTDDQTW